MKAVAHRLLCTLLLTLLLAACAGRPVKTPMDSIDDIEGSPAGRTLLVLLPGAYDVPSDFVTHGFVREIRRRGWPVDVRLVDAHVDYYTSQSVVQRLHEDVIEPARRQGYAAIWLAGISLGGFGSLLYVHQHPGVVRGVILLAPYLGARSYTRDIGRAGGLKQWQPRRDLPLDEEHEMLAWLAQMLRSGAPVQPELWLGYGKSDRFAAAIRVLADAMPPARVRSIEGGHDWPTWERLWSLMLDEDPMIVSR